MKIFENIQNIVFLTRRAEFVILSSRLIRLQGKSDLSSLRHIRTLKAERANNEDISSVQMSI